jgi:hypothetical protein
MSSIIKVDQIQLADGSTPTAAELGLNVSGGLLQVQQGKITGETQFTTSTFTDTGLNKSITPLNSSSKILVNVDIPTRSNTGGISIRVMYSTDGGSTYSEVDVGGKWGHYMAYTNPNSAAWNMSSKMFLHSPSTSNTINYKVQVFAAGGSGNGIICDTSDVAVITLMEIAG